MSVPALRTSLNFFGTLNPDRTSGLLNVGASHVEPIREAGLAL